MRDPVRLIAPLFLSILFLLPQHFRAQEPNTTEVGTPLIQSFNPEEYQASVQNWDILQDSLGLVYIANGRGLLIYNGEDFDLRNFEEVEEARNKLEDYRKELREGDLYEYEGRSTELWQGGRSRLLHDELMIKLARDYHFGKHNLTYEQMNEESLRIQSLRAARLKVQ